MGKAPSAIEVRVAQRGDEREVSALIAAFRDSYDESEPSDEQISRGVSKLIHQADTEFLLAGRPAVGVAQLRYRLAIWTGTEDAWLEDVFVIAEARGSGVGRALVVECVERARSRGCKRIQLDTSEGNKIARSLYESLGFRDAKRPADGRDLYFTLWL
jgi:ribosomal protein S18 acetylase RimI-like enzyme